MSNVNKKEIFIKGYFEKEKRNFLIKSIQFLFRKIIGFFIKLIWIKKINGLENIPKKGPLIVVSNHQSHFDFLSISSIFPRSIYFLSAESLYKKKILKYFLKLTGQIKVERFKRDKRLLNNSIYHFLKDGYTIAMFPEGTRSLEEGEMMKGFTGAIKYSLWHNVPILPIGIKGSYNILPKGAKKIHLKKVIEINIDKPMYLNEYKNTKINKKGYVVVTDKVMLRLAKLSDKKYNKFESWETIKKN